MSSKGMAKMYITYRKIRFNSVKSYSQKIFIWPISLYFGLIIAIAWATPKKAQIDLKFYLLVVYIYINGIKLLLTFF